VQSGRFYGRLTVDISPAATTATEFSGGLVYLSDFVQQVWEDKSEQPLFEVPTDANALRARYTAGGA
jgi:hypothetical protein